ncbi:hypothetical protein X744_15885 [Mesorhizobium sp. LNJC372A00]|nr:hypothetical protein X749_17455 [Mesorhizobium sp. LNJC391B00]ESY54384.1 hypothetical protein X745_16170 [Mesorhizobium sp. LNJC374B00]ESY59514.1 hypothetical protein X744_15885 [Mesorhizobium sp. LNJC372A00]ESZ06170.1 hypothetical protein X736_16445 [Mesorhizobium sp. L2C089B000]
MPAPPAVIDRTETAALGSAQHKDFGDGPSNVSTASCQRDIAKPIALTSSSSVDLGIRFEI